MAVALPSSTLASRRQRHWLRTFVRGNEQKLTYIDGQRGRQSVQQINRRIEPASLDVADGAAVDTRVNSKVLLADAALSSSLSKIPCDARATVHVAQSINLQQSIPSDISDILCTEVWGGLVLRFLRSVSSAVLCSVCLVAPANAQYGLAVPLVLNPPDSGSSAIYSDGSLAGSANGLEDDFAKFQGWWGFEGQDACTHPDPDNWWRVALGRMHITEDGVQFGSGQTQFRMYDAGCDLHDVTVRDGSGDAAAICQNDDGDELTGRFSFMSVPGDRLAVSSPLGDYLLDRCDAPLSIAEIEQPVAEAPKLQPPPSDIAPTPVPSKSSNGPIIRPVLGVPVAPSTIPVAQRNSIGLVYRDHCDPNFGAAYDLSGPSDPELYQPYANQLLIKYGADCTKFYASEVSQIIAIRDVAALVPPATGTSQLDENGAMALGLWLFLAHNPDIGVCMNDEAARHAFVQDQAVAGLVPYGTQDALSWLAKGYASGLETWVLAQQQRRLPACHVFSTQVVHVGLALLALGSANFDFGR